MEPRIKKLFIAALRSGEYHQTANTLCQRKEEEDYFCIGGILCELYRREHPQIAWWIDSDWEGFLTFKLDPHPDDEFQIKSEYSKIIIPAKVLQWAGLGEDQEEALYDMNDHQCFGFPALADVIETQF